MNVLFISVDDMNTDLGCYGHSIVKTPNIDRLAKMGRRFANAYCQQPLCGPSRASVMTGLRPNTLDVLALKDDLRKKNPDVVTLGQFYQKMGYYVGRVGKIYHYANPSQIGSNGHDDAQTWQERFNPMGIDKTREGEVIVYPEGKPKKDTKKKNLGISMAWWDPVSKDEEHTDGMVANRAIEMIDRNRDKPFFVAAGFFNPHCPYVAPKKYFDLYPLDQIPMDNLEEAKKDLQDVPRMAVQRDMGKKWPYYYGLSTEQARKCKQAYFACISFVDAQIGRLINALEERDLMKNTMIVFWSDHGYFLGEKGLWFKRKNFERSLRAPLIIATPNLKNPGLASLRPVELLDLFPTIVQETGYSVPNVLEGKSLTPLLMNPIAPWDKPAISQVVHHRKKAYGFSIRTQRWRYTEWVGGKAGIELYDHEKDSEEIINLAESPDHSDICDKLRSLLTPYAKTMKSYSPKKNR